MKPIVIDFWSLMLHTVYEHQNESTFLTQINHCNLAEDVDVAGNANVKPRNFFESSWQILNLVGWCKAGN